jgi:hypothetical protein
MRVPTLVLLLFVALVAPASARQHEVQLQVLLTFPQIVRGVGVGPGITGDLSIPITCAQPYRGDTVGVVPGIRGRRIIASSPRLRGILQVVFRPAG